MLGETLERSCGQVDNLIAQCVFEMWGKKRLSDQNQYISLNFSVGDERERRNLRCGLVLNALPH